MSITQDITMETVPDNVIVYDPYTNLYFTVTRYELEKVSDEMKKYNAIIQAFIDKTNDLNKS